MDWVTHLETGFVRREAHRAGQVSKGVIYKAEHEPEQVRRNLLGQMFKMKSVFRSYGDYARERTRPCSEAENRLTRSGPQ
jgi:hypothetical protein